MPETPPTFNITTMVELAAAIDVEVKRLWLVAQFFDAVTKSGMVPRTISSGAAQTHEHLRHAIAFFAPDAEEQSEAPTRAATDQLPL